MTVAIFLGLVSPSLLSDGMFLDGVTYADIARNLAAGNGSFWDLHYTSTLYPHFREHPPLAMGIESIFFRWFGDGILVERLYSLGTFLITGWIITRIWIRVADREFRRLGWLPLLFWITVPLVSWAASNNLLENTLMIFTSLSVLFMLESLEGRRVLFLCLAGVILFFGVLTKGFVALFPLTLPAWIWIFGFRSSFRKASLDTLVILLALIVPFLLLFLFVPESKDNLHAYLDEQVLNSLRSVSTVSSRFYILGRLILELIPGFILVLILYILTRNQNVENRSRKGIYLFLCLALSGVLPIMVSLKQRGFYILPAFPFFSLVLAMLAAPRMHFVTDKMMVQTGRFIIFRVGAVIVLAVSLFLNMIQINRVGRDREVIGDIDKLAEIIPQGSTIDVQNELREDWALHAYFQRYASISLNWKTPHVAPYLLLPKGADLEIGENYSLHRIYLHKYQFFTRDSVPSIKEIQ